MNTLAGEPVAVRPPAEKPLLRGVSHQVAFFAAIGAGAALFVLAKSTAAAIASTVFAASLALLFGTSALYHRIHWNPAQRRRMRRLDHAAIFVLIGGGYTPIFALVPSSAGGHGALWVVWAGSIAGVIKSLFWSDAPKWVTALLCVGIGWMAAGQVVDRAASVGSLAVGLMIACGIIYSLGALVYALRRPDPFPRVFGYHEVFHALVILASGCLFAHVVLVLRVTS
jgi:hemolysin III